MKTIDTTQARAYFGAPRFAAAQTHVELWARPVQGSILSVPATRLASTVGANCSMSATSANAAKGATRKDATGGGAFEDPV